MESQKKSMSLLLLAGLLLLPLWPALEFIDKNKNEHSFDIIWIAISAAIVILFLYATYIVIHKFISRVYSLKILVTLSVFLCFSQFYFDISSRFLEGYSLAMSLNIFFIMLTAVSAAAWFIAGTKMIFAVGIYSLVIILFPIGHLISDRGIITLNIFEAAARNPVVTSASRNDMPNVYYFIFDGYLRSDMLKKHFDYDNSDFIEALELRGFSIASRSRSNFPTTAYSVNYLLNPSFANEDENKLPALLKGNSSFIGGKQSEVENKFRALGYEFVMMNHIGRPNSACNPYCISKRRSIPFSLIQFYKTLPIYDFIKVYYPGLLWNWVSTIPNDNRFALNEIPKQISKPIFLFSHALIPHPPYSVLPDCSPNSRGVIDFSMEIKKDMQLWREGYLDQIGCSNVQMLEIADRLQKADPEAIVFFVSDHGWKASYAKKLPSDEREKNILFKKIRVSNLIALRAPTYCMKYYKDDITLVNSFPLAFACLNKSIPEFVKNRSYFIVGKNKDSIEDVTEAVLN